jgi:glycerol kinase
LTSSHSHTTPNPPTPEFPGDALFGTIDTWLIWKLTNGASHATDVTNASRTLCMNLKTLQWDEEILRDLNIPRKMLPAIYPSSYLFG